jgi:hypothetical protein
MTIFSTWLVHKISSTSGHVPGAKPGKVLANEKVKRGAYCPLGNVIRQRKRKHKIILCRPVNYLMAELLRRLRRS